MSHHNVNCMACEKCICNTCANDHATCCSVDHDAGPCPTLECEYYEREAEE